MKDIVVSLRRKGITPLYRGYRQLLYALSIALSERCPPAKTLYTKTADHFCCSWRSVEHNIRTLAKRAWEVNPSYLSEIFGRELQHTPSSAQFIAMLYSYIQFSSWQE